MRPPFPRLSLAWIALIFSAAGFLGWADWHRAEHVRSVSRIDAEGARWDAASPTGFVDGKRWLIVPEHHTRTFQWIAETQQMLARNEWRVRRVDFENAPFGREVASASPGRWWLGLLAWCDHARSGRPLGAAVERAALFADPLLHLVILGVTVLLVARWLGVVPAVLAGLGWATWFPLAATFLPGVVDYRGLAAALGCWSVMPLIAARAGRPRPAPGAAPDCADAPAARRQRIRFIGAGVIGGLGLWISSASEAPIIAGIALGGLLAAVIARGRPTAAGPTDTAPLPWREWALGGAVTSLFAYFVEYGPHHLALRLQTNHPLFALAWLGLSELLTQADSAIRCRRPVRGVRPIAASVLALAAVTALPAAMALTHVHGFLGSDPLATRLTSLPDGTVAPNFAAWIVRDGLTGSLVATCLPLLLMGWAIVRVARSPAELRDRRSLALALGPAFVALGFAFVQLRWWSMLDGTLVALLAASANAVETERASGRRRRWWPAMAGLAFAAGAVLLWPPQGGGAGGELTKREVEALLERSLAHWIADHAGTRGTVVLAPPDRTVSLDFYGRLRGLGTPNWENREGLAATTQIVTATTADEAQALLGQHEVRYIVLPSWDSDLDDFVRWTLRRPEDSFLSALQHWKLPPWIRPLPYHLPMVAGFEGESLLVFEVTDESNRSLALSRLAEYFVEMQQPDLAMSAALALRRYPASLGALAAIAQAEKSAGDPAGFAKDVSELASMVSAGLDRALPWDRRVSLAVVLAEGGRTDLARIEVSRCLDQIDDARIRSLTTASLYRLLVLKKTLGLDMPDGRLAARALRLLPRELRSRL